MAYSIQVIYCHIYLSIGALVQLTRTSALQAEGHEFESHTLHQYKLFIIVMSANRYGRVTIVVLWRGLENRWCGKTHGNRALTLPHSQMESKP